MKRLLIFVMMVSSIQLKSQALEIINAIGGTLLPKVVDGIKEIKDSGNKNKVKYNKEEFDKKMKDLNDYMTGISSSISNDAKSLDAIGTIASKASQLYDDLGALESLSNGLLVNAVIASNNEVVQREYSMVFDSDRAQLIQDIDGIKTSVLSLTIDQGLKDNLTQLVDNVRSEYQDFESLMFHSGLARPTASSTIASIVKYLEAIKRSEKKIGSIKQSTQSMLSTLNSRLSSYVEQSKITQENVDKKFKEIVE